MRLALVHYSVPPIVGGVEKIIDAHATLFRRAGHDVNVISRSGQPDVLLKDADPYESLKSAAAGAEVVIAHNVLTMPFDMALTDALWRLSMEEPSKRWIAWVHDLAVCNPHYEHDWHRPPWNVLSQACSGFEYVAVSEFRARQFEALTGRHASVIPNGIDPAELLGLTPAVAKLAADYQLHQRELVLLHPTRLLKRKNVEFGLEVLAELRRNGTDAVLLITAAGDPHNTASVDYGNWLRTRRNELSLDDSALFVSDEFQPAVADITSLYAIADALFFPSTQEGFGLPVLEAALHRLPIFCADTQPTRTLLDHSIHLFDAHGSPSTAAAFIQTTVQQSAPYRARRQAMRQYSWEVIWDKHLAPLLRVRR